MGQPTDSQNEQIEATTKNDQTLESYEKTSTTELALNPQLYVILLGEID
jgi:hypothetical protein